VGDARDGTLMPVQVREGDVEVDPDRLPRKGFAVRGDDFYEDGRRLGRVVELGDVLDYTHPRGGPSFAYTRVTFTPEQRR
jgi:hypothetical protein